MRPCS